MTFRGNNLVLLSTVVFILISTSTSFYLEKLPARVLISEDRSIEDGYTVEIEANGQTRQLRLTPTESVWSDVAQALIITSNEHGEQIFERKNIPKDIKVYHDSEAGAILSVKEGKLNGILDADYMIKSEEGSHFLIKSSQKDLGKSDYRRLPTDVPKMVYKRIFREERNDTVKLPIPMINNDYFRLITTYTGEVTVLVDSTLANLIGTDTQIYEYLTIFWNAVNRRYRTILSPKIVVRLVGSVIIRTSSGEPFITNNLSGKNVWGDNCLVAESKWVFSKMSTLPPHDLIYLQTGRDLIDTDGSTSLGGIAYMGAACVKNGGNSNSYAVGLGEDIGAFYDGVHIATHEVAHLLGAPHDADAADGTSSCPWSDGFIMSYEAGSPNHMKFSSCSINKMSTYLASSEATCVRSNLTQTKPTGVYTSTSLPGDKITLTEQCQRILGISNAEVYTDLSPEDPLCYSLQCTYPDSAGNGWWLADTLESGAEGAACPTSGHCFDGKCV